MHGFLGLTGTRGRMSSDEPVSYPTLGERGGNPATLRAFVLAALLTVAALVAASPAHAAHACKGHKIWSHRMIPAPRNGISLGVLELYRAGYQTCAILRRTSNRGDRYLGMAVTIVRCPRRAPEACTDSPQLRYPSRQSHIGNHRHRSLPVTLPTGGHCVRAYGSIQTARTASATAAAATRSRHPRTGGASASDSEA